MSSSCTPVRLEACWGVTGALTLDLIEDASSSSEVKSDRRFSLRFRTCLVGLPADARAEYEPFQVDLLFLDGEELERSRETGRDKGRGLSYGSGEEKPDAMGEWGAYISEIWASSEGEVRAENSWRMLSHWVWDVWSDDWRATRIGEDRFTGL